jgi:hypothetical protein
MIITNPKKLRKKMPIVPNIDSQFARLSGLPRDRGAKPFQAA